MARTQSLKERRAELHRNEDKRKDLHEKLIKHLREGYSFDCFPYLSQKALKELMSAFPEEFDPEEIDEAIEFGKHCWEKIGKEQAAGSCMGNSRTWFYNMSNRYGWREKQEVKQDVSGHVSISVISYSADNSA